MAVYVQPQIGRVEYKVFKRLMPDDENLPESYDEWLKEQQKERDKIIKAGDLVKEIPVEAEEFVRHCRASGMKTDSSSLGSFTVAKALKEKLLASPVSKMGRGLIDIGR